MTSSTGRCEDEEDDEEEPTGAEHKHAWDTSSLCRQTLSTRSEAGAEAEAG